MTPMIGQVKPLDFVLIAESKPPSRTELAREWILICRLYLGLMRTITDDYGAEFAAHNDSLAYRTIGICVFLRSVMCSPVRASQIAGSGLPARPSPLSGKCPGGKRLIFRLHPVADWYTLMISNARQAGQIH
jgi:hypothetical protein